MRAPCDIWDVSCTRYPLVVPNGILVGYVLFGLSHLGGLKELVVLGGVFVWGL